MSRDVGVRLRHARKLKGMTQQALEKASGVTQATISEVETGESKSPVGTNLIKLAQSLEVRPEWLATGKGPMVSTDSPLPQRAIQLAKDWLRLDPESQAKIHDLIKTMVKTSAADQPAVPDERVADAYGKPGPKGKSRSKA